MFNLLAKEIDKTTSYLSTWCIHAWWVEDSIQLIRSRALVQCTTKTAKRSGDCGVIENVVFYTFKEISLVEGGDGGRRENF